MSAQMIEKWRMIIFSFTRQMSHPRKRSMNMVFTLTLKTIADGNCIFAAVIGNINSRDCFSSKIDLSPSEARGIWLNKIHNEVKFLSRIKYMKYFLPALAHTLQYSILIFNTRH